MGLPTGIQGIAMNIGGVFLLRSDGMGEDDVLMAVLDAGARAAAGGPTTKGTVSGDRSRASYMENGERRLGRGEALGQGAAADPELDPQGLRSRT